MPSSCCWNWRAGGRKERREVSESFDNERERVREGQDERRSSLLGLLTTQTTFFSLMSFLNADPVPSSVVVATYSILPFLQRSERAAEAGNRIEYLKLPAEREGHPRGFSKRERKRRAETRPTTVDSTRLPRLLQNDVWAHMLTPLSRRTSPPFSSDPSCSSSLLKISDSSKSEDPD